MKRQSIYFIAPLVAEVREEEMPPIGEGEVLVETLLSAVSPGTEMLVYRGLAPADLAVDDTIAALGGTFGFPIKFGYAAVGRVVEIGTAVEKNWLGRVVFAFNPHESHFVAHTSALHPLPEGIEPEAAVFLPNVETTVSFLMDGRPVIGERVTVVGQGVVGLLTTALLSEFPLEALAVVDPLPFRRSWALELGANQALTPETAEGVLGHTSDLTYELSGNPRGLDSAIALTAAYGRVVIGSWYGNKPVELNLGGRFHRAHIRLIGTQVSALGPEWLGRWTKERRLSVGWGMLRRHRPERLITHRLPVSRAAEAYRLLDEHQDGVIQTVFTYS